MTPESVDDLYHGITPELVPDFYGLKGDTSDNIPGVPGIGPKKASQLIVQYGSLDEVIAHADEVKGKMGENLRAHIDDALLSRKVATIRTDAPIELELADAKFPTFDPADVVSAFSALGFTGMTSRLVRLGGQDAASAAPTFTVPAVVEDTNEVRAALVTGSWVAVANEAQDAPKKRGQMSLLLGEEEQKPVALWFATRASLARAEGDDALALLARIVREGRLVAGDVKAVLHAACPADSSLPALFEPHEVSPARIFDTGVAAYLLDSDQVQVSSFEVPELVGHYLQTTLPDPTDELPQAALEAAGAYALRQVLTDALERDGSSSLMSDIEMPLLPVLLGMERTGLHADASVLQEQSAELGAEIDQMVARIYEAAGEKFNIDSPMQLSHVLFDVLGLPTYGLKKTRTGFYSTNAKVLGDLSYNPVVADVLDYRERAKIRSTYLDALPALIKADGRIHTSLNQTVAATGRLSSSEPNLQNIPTRSALGHRVRTAFTVPEDSVFLACDYSQIELRLLAHLSADEHLVAAFNEGEDFHAATAARVFGVPVDQVSPQLRSRAKAVNFGIVYGQQAFGLASSLKISRNEAQQMIDRYFEAYPGVRAFLDAQVAFAKKNKFVSITEEIEAGLKGEPYAPKAFAHPIAYNVIPQIGSEQYLGYTSEEMKMQNEGRKILHLPDMRVSCTCVRVPVLRSHSVSVVLRTREKISVDRARALVAAAPGCKLVDDLPNRVYPMPLDTSDQDLVFVGRIREDLTSDRGLNLWCCGDQIRKGAATNAVQIAELLL